MPSLHVPQPEVLADAPFPYLIVRTFYGVYQRERIQIRVGPPAVEIANRRCSVQHPSPRAADGRISAPCRDLLLSGVQHAVRGLHWRMCVVWAEAACTYVETDKLVESADVPSGGVVAFDLKFAAPTFFPSTRPPSDRRR
jgi:hypothetical protein